MVKSPQQQKEAETENDLLEGVDFRKAKITQKFTQKGTEWLVMVRLSSGNVVCGGSDKTIDLFDSQFKEISSKPLNGVLLSALLVGNYIYCGLDNSCVVMFDESLKEIKKINLSDCVRLLLCVDSSSKLVAL
jgi:hypothetical protein